MRDGSFEPVEERGCDIGEVGAWWQLLSETGEEDFDG